METNNNKILSNCGSILLLGGFNVAGKNAIISKKYLYDSTKINKIIIEFDLYALDTWNNEKFFVTGFGV